MTHHAVIKLNQNISEQLEQMGTKSKAWIVEGSENHDVWLFKQGRENTLENVAEKIACELAALIEMPHATYELADKNGLRGVLSQSVVSKENGEQLVHGNELLRSEALYPETFGDLSKREQRRLFTPSRLIKCLMHDEIIILPPKNWGNDEMKDALEVFVGYLLFDVGIANQDRHDENWAVIKYSDGAYHLAPSFDHGSSMGRNETDDIRKTRLTTKDRNHNIEAYTVKARSGIFSDEANETKSLLGLEAAAIIGKKVPQAANYWKTKIINITKEQITQIVNQIPSEWMSDIARQFTIELLCENQNRMKECRFE